MALRACDFWRCPREGPMVCGLPAQNLEANATPDTITYDDFSAGGTARKGHVIMTACNLFDWWQLGFTSYIAQKIDPQRTVANAQPGINGQTRLRVMVDSMFKF